MLEQHEDKMTCFFAGFSAWLVQYLVYLKELPVWAINLIVSTLTATMTEVVSNTATANILLPILKEMSLTLCYNPVYMGETLIVLWLLSTSILAPAVLMR